MIFLDHSAGAPIHPLVRKGVISLLGEGWANPSSPHGSGRRARELLEEARESVSRSVGQEPTRITFSSGATESNAAALAHWARLAGGRRTVVSTPVEHPSVLLGLRRLEREGWTLRLAPVDASGRIDPAWIEGALDDSVAFAACMSAQNETGVLHPWREWAEACAGKGIPFHLDATQSWGKEDLDLSGVRGSASWSGHKLGALSGAGVLWLSDVSGFRGLAEGGPQERERRSGTEPVLAVASLGIVAGNLPGRAEWDRWRGWAGELWAAVADIPGVSRTAPAEDVLPGVLHLRIPFRAETAVVRLDMAGVAASAGSACSSGSMRPSEVLMSMGWTRDQAARGLRLSAGHAVDGTGIAAAAAILRRILS